MPDPPDDLPGSPPPLPPDPPYQSLYRRFRPQRFDEVRGQDHVTRALRNAVRDGRVAHAYLFSGPRGTGKTSTARILAMALNCENPGEGEPDGTCASCVDIRRGASVDVQELDAASNRRLDEMRDLLSRVALGTRGRWKVYIIDEVHQLTGDAASALLKTLEEPPGHVVFVLATTDPQKVLPTIRSRTIHFEFHLLASDVLGHLLHDINDRAGLGVPPEAIDLVVRRGHGSARDALTVLDQVAAAGGTEDEAEVVGQIVNGLTERDAGQVLVAVAEGMASGRDARRLAADLLDHLRNGFLATMARGLVMLPDDAVAEVAEQAHRLGLAALVRAMEEIGQALADMRDSVDPRVTLEVALVRLARPEADTSVAALLERIERLERAASRSGGKVAPLSASTSTGPQPVAPQARPPASGSVSAPPPTPGRPTDLPAKPALGALRPRPDQPGRVDGAGAAVAADVPGRADGPGAAVAADVPGRAHGAGAAAARRPGPADLPGRADGPPPAGLSPAPAEPPRSPTGQLPAPASGRPSTDPPVSPSAGSSPPPPGRPAAVSHPAPPGPTGPSSAVRPPGPSSSSSSSSAASPPTGGPAQSVRPGQAGDLGLPSRDELTKAWGDGVLRGLSGKAKAYLGSGRFVSGDNRGAVFAVPDQHLLSRAKDVRVEAEEALAARFRRPVPLTLIIDPGAQPLNRPPEPEEGLTAEDLHHLEDASSAVTSPEQRLLDAFPGAEEVSS